MQTLWRNQTLNANSIRKTGPIAGKQVTKVVLDHDE